MHFTKQFNEFLGRRSFRSVLTASFIFVSILPLLTLQVLSNARIRQNLQDNMNQLSHLNAEQTATNLRLTLDAYQDILYQLYTNDDLIGYVENIENAKDTALNTNQLNRILNEICYAKNYIESVTILTPSGTALFRDKLKASSIYSSWLDNYGMSLENILLFGMQDYQTKLLPTRFATNQGATPYYLFHMVHRIIDHKDISRDIGVVILSLNEELLHEAYQQNLSGSFSFIVDESGSIISYPKKERIGSNLSLFSDEASTSFASKINALLRQDNYLYPYTSWYPSSPVRNWSLVHVIDQSTLHLEISTQNRALLLASLAIFVIIGVLIFLITSLLARSMNRFVGVMKTAETGKLTSYLNADDTFSREMHVIADTYNGLMHRVQLLMGETKEAADRQKNAEIKTLEAQINPHFLYNVLDSINWMSIGKEQFEISGMITALARILRYSIDNSNAIVPLRDEIQWLRQYIHLQQVRLKHGFSFTLNVDESLMRHPVHKLLFQPFVENAIIHGFMDERPDNRLEITIQHEQAMRICIRDNGRGMDTALLERALKAENNGHIGIANAIGRIHMYYGSFAHVQVQSAPDAGTTVMIILPLRKGEDAHEGSCR